MKKYVVNVNGNRYEVEVEEVQGDFSSVPTPVSTPKPSVKKAAAPVAAVKKSTAEGEKVECPMPGNIFKVNFKAGDSIKKGDILFVLEAMKMENEIMSPRDGKIIEVNVGVGDQVNTGDVLAVIE